MRCGRAAVAASARSPTPGPAPSAQATAPRQEAIEAAALPHRSRRPIGWRSRSASRAGRGGPRTGAPPASRSASSEASGPTTSDEGRSRATPTPLPDSAAGSAPSPPPPRPPASSRRCVGVSCHHSDARTCGSSLPRRPGRSDLGRQPPGSAMRSAASRSSGPAGPSRRAGRGPGRHLVERRHGVQRTVGGTSGRHGERCRRGPISRCPPALRLRHEPRQAQGQRGPERQVGPQGGDPEAPHQRRGDRHLVGRRRQEGVRQEHRHGRSDHAGQRRCSGHPAARSRRSRIVAPRPRAAAMQITAT